MTIPEILKDHEQLKMLLKEVPFNVLADEVAIRPEAATLRQGGLHVLILPNK